MHRSAELNLHTRELDITDFKLKFDKLFSSKKSHDVYKFMMHLLNILSLETIDRYTIMGRNENIEKYFKAGICNQSFGLMVENSFTCKNDHTTKSLQPFLFLNLK